MTEQIKLFHGDYLDEIQNISDKSIDVIITDPPYNFDFAGGGFYSEKRAGHRKYIEKLKSLNCCDFEPIEFLNSVKPKMKLFYAYIFCNKTLLADYILWAKKHNYFYDILVMCKLNPIPAYNNHYLSDLEYIIVIREFGTYFSHEKDIELFRKYYLTNCKQEIHPAQKPISLIKKFIQVASKESDTILDPFMGSGTTGVACKLLNRKFVGIEIDEKYFNIAKQRIAGEIVREKINENELNEFLLFQE